MDVEGIIVPVSCFIVLFLWDKETGIPTRETLEKFGLPDCADKLEELGEVVEAAEAAEAESESEE